MHVPPQVVGPNVRRHTWRQTCPARLWPICGAMGSSAQIALRDWQDQCHAQPQENCDGLLAQGLGA
jgi:hypothetical protein